MKHTTSPHIVYIITQLELGGAQKVCLSLFHAIPQQNTTLISSARGYFVEQLKEKKNVILLPHLQRDISAQTVLNEVRCFAHLIRTLRALKKKHPHLIVHTHSTKAGLLGRWASLLAGVHIRIHTVHGFGFHAYQNKIAWLLTYLTELITSFITTHYVCVASQNVKTGITLLPKFTHKHSIIRAAVDWKQFYNPSRTQIPFPEQQHHFIFGTVACFKKQKNIFDLLNAFALVHKTCPNTRLELIGDGILRPAIEKWIAQKNLESVITLHGWQQTVVHAMQRWHVFVLSSLWEGLPCAIIEARLLKLPVIAYDTDGIRDIITTTENGILIPQGAWQELAHAMEQIAQDKALFRTLQSYPDNLSDFNDASMIAQHTKLYTTLSNGSYNKAS